MPAGARPWTARPAWRSRTRTLVDIERSLGLFFEPGLQAWAKGEEWLLWFANWMYVNSHFVVTTTFLIWLYIARNHAYYLRNMFMVAMGLALVGYLAYPRRRRASCRVGLLGHGASFVGETAEQSANVLYNPFAAVPSMHVAFALMIAVPAFVLVRRHRVLKALWAVYPLVVTFVVMVTANHYWLDAALEALVAAVSAYAASAARTRAAGGVGVPHRRRQGASERRRLRTASRRDDIPCAASRPAWLSPARREGGSLTEPRSGCWRARG